MNCSRTCIVQIRSLGWRPLVMTLVLGACLFAVWQTTPSRSQGCMAVHPKDVTVEIAEESAVIVWDAANKTQHFIRWAAFVTQAVDFGFLVPTPAQPVLAEVSDATFDILNALLKPGYEVHLSSCCLSSISCSKKEAKPATGEVRLLHEQRVGGFDAAVVEADDAQALNEWLNRYGYVANPGLTSWLAPYIRNKWKITAFRIVQDPKTGRPVKTQPVRMSFAADRPYFPYREPQLDHGGERGDARLLRIFLISDQRMSGRLGDGASSDRNWRARVSWANRLMDRQRNQVAADLGFKEDNPIPSNAWLTTFEDRTARRPGNDDVYFAVAPNQDPVLPENIPILIPLEAVLGVVAVVLLVIRRRMRTSTESKGNWPER